jgi:maltooligosyltrehalose synthase
VRRGFVARPHPELLVLEAQTDADHLTDLFMGLIERLPSGDNLEIRLLDHFDDAGQTDVWLTSRVDGKKILRFLDDHDDELFGNGHLELSIYVRAHHGTLRLTEHKTVVWLASARALEADVVRWLGELGVPRGDTLTTIKDVPHFHYRPAASRDRKKLAAELYRQRLRRVDRVRPQLSASAERR